MDMGVPLPEAELIRLLTSLLDRLGPFSPQTLRKDKWRTTEQLTYELGQLGSPINLDLVDQTLHQYEARYHVRLQNGSPPDAAIRRATYPDRTTALPLWGSTKYHGQPWRDQAGAERLDPPEHAPVEVDEAAPRVFLSHTHIDAGLANSVAYALAAMGIRAWMFETDIEYRGPIASCVRSAIASTACCLALLTRASIASLWVLTELHTALESKKPVVLVIDAGDQLLLDLLQSVRFQSPGQRFDLAVQYDLEIVRKLHADYSVSETESRASRYPSQVKDFLATLPAYLANRPALTYPGVPTLCSGPFPLTRLEQLSLFMP